jgi:iron complex transport system permease protein
MTARFHERNRVFILLFLGIAAFVVTSCAAFLGMKIISPAAVVEHALDREIFWMLRVPRVLAAFCAGSGLALCGMVYQAVFRNPLADPFTLGTASGASCGAAITILLGIAGSFAGVQAVSIGAFVGAVTAMVSVYAISSLKKTSSGITMLLAGIAVSFLFSSILMLFQYLSSYRDSFQIVRWLMGGIQVTGYGSLVSLFSFWAVGVALIAVRLPALDQLCAGEDLARSRGVDVAATKQWLLVASTLVIAGIVAVCGPIGFVGLMVPHICRRLVGANHLLLGPASVFLGGILLVIADTVCRTIIAPAELPVGVLTALIGGPFFLWLLFGMAGTRDSVG